MSKLNYLATATAGILMLVGTSTASEVAYSPPVKAPVVNYDSATMHSLQSQKLEQLIRAYDSLGRVRYQVEKITIEPTNMPYIKARNLIVAEMDSLRMQMKPYESNEVFTKDFIPYEKRYVAGPQVTQSPVSIGPQPHDSSQGQTRLNEITKEIQRRRAMRSSAGPQPTYNPQSAGPIPHLDDTQSKLEQMAKERIATPEPVK